MARRELEALLSGEADANDAFVRSACGCSGTESPDWANMLSAHVRALGPSSTTTRSSISKNRKCEEAGIKSATVKVVGHNALWLAQIGKRGASSGAHLARSIPMRAGTPRSQTREFTRWSTTASS